MCVVCQIEGQDWKFKNGPKKPEIFNLKLYNFYQDKVAQIDVCHCHSYELFLLGERRFIMNYPKLIREMVHHKKNYALKDVASRF
jgi:hypothetical protein